MSVSDNPAKLSLRHLVYKLFFSNQQLVSRNHFLQNLSQVLFCEFEINFTHYFGYLDKLNWQYESRYFYFKIVWNKLYSRLVSA